MKPLLNALFFVATLFAAHAVAGETPYSQAAFDRLQQQGRPVLVAVHADWCPTCRAQAPIIQDLLRQPKYQDIQLLRVDYDRQKEVVKHFRASRQSTLIVFKDGSEVGRSLGDTTRSGIARLLDLAL